MDMNENKRIYLSPPDIGELEKQYVAEAFATNWVAPLGPNLDALEEGLSAWAAGKPVCALSSGTAALHLVLKLLGIERGDYVFCSSLTFIASVSPILYEGGIPVFIDSDPETWNMSPQALEVALSVYAKKGCLPKAVISVDLYGQCADYDKISEICARYDVILIEDAAEALGATYKGKPAGSFGKFAVFSFNGNKIITTSGGGAIVCPDEASYTRARHLATQAREAFPYYQHVDVGYNYRLSNISAGIGRGQLAGLAEKVITRRAIFERYSAAFCQSADDSHAGCFVAMPEPQGFVSTRWLSVFLLNSAVISPDKMTPLQLCEKLAQSNIEARLVWKPMHLQPIFAGCTYFTHSCEQLISTSGNQPLSEGDISAKLFVQGVCLPSGSSLTKAEQEKVIGEIKKALAE